MKRRSFVELKISTAIIAFLLMEIAVNQDVVANPPSSAPFGIKEAELPVHYANLFFGKLEEVEQNSILLRVSAFVWANEIRRLASEINRIHQSTVARSQKQGKRGRSGVGQKNAAETAGIRNTNVLKGLLLKLVDLEGKTVNRQIIDSLENMWTVFKAVLKDVGNFDGIDIEAMIEEYKKVSDDADWDRDGYIWEELAPLHMKVVKPLLLTKDGPVNDNKLVEEFLKREIKKDVQVEDEEPSETFEQWKAREDKQVEVEMTYVKSKMRRMLGKGMFESLEMQEPILFKLDIVEGSELQRLYQQMFSYPIHSEGWLLAKQQLEIRYLFREVNHLSKKADKFGLEVQKIRRKALKSLGGLTLQEALDKLVWAYDETRHKLNHQMRILNQNMEIVNWELMLQETHKNCLIAIFKATGKFKQFFDETPGARARVNKTLGENTPKTLMDFDWNFDTILDKLAVNYYQLAVSVENKTEESKLKLLKARVNADVLIQLFWLERFLLEQQRKGKEETSQWWSDFRSRVLLFLDHIVDADQKFTDSFACSLNNMLYRFKMLETMVGKWDKIKEQADECLVQLDEIRRREFYKESLPQIGGPLDAEKRAEWLGKEHREILKLLVLHSNTEAKQQIRVNQNFALNDKQMKQLAKSLNDGQEKEIWKDWLKIMKKTIILPQIPGVNEENKELGKELVMKQKEKIGQTEEKSTDEERNKTAVGKAKGKGKAPLVEGEDQEENYQNLTDDENENESLQLSGLYFQAIADEFTELQRLRAKTAVDVIVQLLWLDELFNAQARWTKMHMFLDYLNQLEAAEGDEVWVRNSAVLYGNMLYKLRVHGRKDCNLDELLGQELKELKQFEGWEQNGRMGKLPNVEPIEAVFQKEWLQNEHKRTIGILRENENKKFSRWLAVLISSEKDRLEKLTGEKNRGIIKDEERVKNQPEKGLPSSTTAKKKSKDGGKNDVIKMANVEKPIFEADKANKNMDKLIEQKLLEVQQKESIYFECPKDGDNVSIILKPKSPIMLFLTTTHGADLKSLKLEANLETLEWHYRRKINKLFITDSYLRNKESFVQDWNELSNKSTKELDSLTDQRSLTIRMEQALCKYHHFLVHTILNYEEMAQIGESERAEMLKNNSEIKWFREVPTVDCDNVLEAATLATSLLKHPNLQEVHSQHFNWQIGEYENIRRHLCANNPVLVKRRLLELTNLQALDQLEIEHPEMLKIDKMNPEMRIQLYRVYISHRSGTAESLNAELRIAISLLICFHNQLEVDFSDMAAEAIREKVLWLKQRIFLDRANPVVSLRNICLLMSFNDFVGKLGLAHLEKQNKTVVRQQVFAVNKNDEKMMDKNIPKSSDVTDSVCVEKNNVYAACLRRWSGEDVCHELGWQEDTMQMQRDFLAPYHKSFILSAENRSSLNEMVEDPWKRARLRKLMLFPENLFESYDLGVFTNDIQLRNLINEFLFGNDEESRLAAYLGVNFIVWSHWMEAHLDGKLKSPEADLVKEVWQEIQPNLLKKFDEIFDQNTEELKKGRNNWARVQEIIPAELDKFKFKKGKISKEAQMKEQKVKLRETILALLDYMGVHEKDWNDARFEKATRKTALKNREKLLKLLKQTDEQVPSFKELLLKSFQKDPEAKKRLPELVGAAGVKPIAKLLGWERWKPKEFGLKIEQINAAETEEKLEMLEWEKLGLEQAEKVKMSEKSVDEIAKELGSLGGSTLSPAKPTKQKASKRKGAKTNNNNKTSHLSSAADGIASPPSDGFNPTEAKGKESLLTIHESKIGMMDDQSAGSISNRHQGETIVFTKSSKKKKKTASKNSLKTSGDNSIVEAEHSELKDSEPKKSKRKIIVETSEHSTSSSGGSLSKMDNQNLEKQKPSSGLFKPKVQSTMLKWRQAEVTEQLLKILRTEGLLLERPSSDTTPTDFPITDSDKSIEKAIERLKDIVRIWKKEAILLVGGSYLLQLNTADSDIDCILLLPFDEKNDKDWIDLYVQHYFGNQIGPNEEVKEVMCNLESEERNCPTETSLYCMICKDHNVKSLQKRFGRNNDPMIQVQFHGIHFDISFVPIPNEVAASDRKEKQSLGAILASKDEEGIMKNLSSVRKVDKMITYFIDWWKDIHNADGRKGMLWALSGYRANLRMRDLLKGKSFDNFRTVLLAVKLWAKNHFVYGAKFGLLNGSTLTTMLLHVFLGNLHDIIPSLLAKFFSTFSHWKWPKPVELEGAFNVEFRKDYGTLDWKEFSDKNDRANQLSVHINVSMAEEYAQLVWPVILPGFPTQNPAFNVNKWTSLAMLNEFEQAFKQMEPIDKAIENKSGLNIEGIKELWTSWFQGGEFHEKYQHFVVIFCAAHTVQHVRTFCDYVESRIRLQLLLSFGDLSQVQWMHPSPERVHDGLPCPSEEKPHLPDGQWLCTIWLVGVQLGKNMEKEKVQQILEEKLIYKDFIGRNESQKEEERSRLEDFSHKIVQRFEDLKKPNSSIRGISEGRPHHSYSVKSPQPSGAGAKTSLEKKVKEKLWSKYFTRENVEKYLQKILPNEKKRLNDLA